MWVLTATKSDRCGESMRSPVLLAVLTPLLFAGCTDDPGAAEAIAATITFVGANPEQQCELLAPSTRSQVADDPTVCPEALARLSLPRGTDVRSVVVAGTSAQVVLGDDVIFLARFTDGWRVRAAGCSRADPDPAVPYDCEVRP